MSDWTDHALLTLQRRGLRRGRARRLVIEVLGGEDCALSAQEIDARLGGDVGMASVYRVLELLTDLKLVHRLDMGQGQASYETIDPSGEHHHHAVCGHCGRLEPFEDADLERAVDRLADKVGFSVDAHEVVLHGRCPDCS